MSAAHNRHKAIVLVHLAAAAATRFEWNSVSWDHVRRIRNHKDDAEKLVMSGPPWALSDVDNKADIAVVHSRIKAKLAELTIPIAEGSSSSSSETEAAEPE